MEVEWLIKKEFPIICNYINNAFHDHLQSSFGKYVSSYKLMCTSSTCGVESLKGSLVLHHDTICSMELFMKPTKLQPTIKASFRSDKQWKLQQIQDAYNHMREASNIVREVQDERFSAEGLVIVLDDVTRHLARCQARLTSPCQLTLNSLINSAFSKMFSPPLPGDTLVNMFVVEDRVVMVSYTVQQAHTNASLSAGKGGKLHSESFVAGKSLFHPAASVLEHAGSRYEVATVNRAETRVPALTELLSATSAAQQLCQHLRDQLTTLSRHWTAKR